MPRLVWDNGKLVPPAKDTKSHMLHYVPHGADSPFDLTYKHILSIGALKMQEHCREHLDKAWRQDRAKDIVAGIFAKLDTE